MGYILPVTNYQYNHYAQRELKSKYDPFRFVPVMNIKPARNSKEFQPPMERKQHKPVKTNRQYGLNSRELISKERLYSLLTGKGQHINESV